MKDKSKRFKWGLILGGIGVIGLLGSFTETTDVGSLIGGSVLFIVVGVVLLYLDKKFPDKHKGTRSETNSENIPQRATTAPLDMSISTRTQYVECEPIGELSHVNVGDVSGELGCYLNFTPQKLCPPSDRQYEYARGLGIVLPSGITNIDISHMINRATGEDSIESPSSGLASYANKLGCQFSAYIGETGLLRCIIKISSPRDLTAFYMYAVCKNRLGQRLGDMITDPEINMYYRFADQAITDPALFKSIQGREASDFLQPHKGSNAYKAAIAFLSGVN